MTVDKKNRIINDISKEFWDKSSYSLRYIILKSYMVYLNTEPSYVMYKSYISDISLLTWDEIISHDYPISTSEIKKSVSYFVGIGDYEGGLSRSINVNILREYKLKMLDISE